MSDGVKLSLAIPRKNVLLLAKVIEQGLTMKDDGQGGLLSVVSRESLSELVNISSDLLQKAGLTEMYDRLNSLQLK